MLSNRIYQQLSNAVAGSQEFTAIAKLYELDQEGDYDLLVLDTPPSRNALDFLDAPEPADAGSSRAARSSCSCAGRHRRRMLGRGTGMVFGLLERLTGVDLLHDLSVFFRALGGMIDGFTERARRVGALLEDPGTTFLIVTAPAPRPGRGGDLLPPQAADAVMPFGGLVVNRMHARAGRATARPPPGELGEDLAAPRGHRGRTSWPRWPSARRRASSTCATRWATRRRSWCPSSTATSTTSRGSR